MAYSYFTQLFGGGFNQDMAPVMLDLSSQNSMMNVIATASNFLFERGELISRPGIGSNPVTFPTSAPIRAMKWLPFPARTAGTPVQNRMGFIFLNDGTLYSLAALQSSTVLTPTQITGPTIVMFTDSYCDHSIVNGVTMIAGNTGGLVRWDPNQTTYTVLSTAKYGYVCGHLARAFAAYDVGQNEPGYWTKVAWSAPGDETTWTGATSGAGSSILADVDDAITGVKVCNGVVAIARTYGFHIGIPTGQFPVVYDFRKLSSMSVGCMHPATLIVYKNTLFFMSGTGIHTFDFAEINDIGEGVYKEISWFINQEQYTPRAFISTSHGPIDFQPSYNIVLESPVVTVNPSAAPHYMYNLREKKWSRHFYPSVGATGFTPIACGFDYISQASSLNNPAPISLMTILQRGTTGVQPAVSSWVAPDNPDGTGQGNSDTVASFTTGQITLDDPLHDMQVDRVQLFYFIPSVSTFSFTVSAVGVLSNQNVTNTVTVTTPNSLGLWVRQWVNFRMTANVIQFTVSFPANTPGPIRIKQMVIEYSAVGKARI